MKNTQLSGTLQRLDNRGHFLHESSWLRLRVVTLLLLTCPQRCLDVAVSHLRDCSQKLIALKARRAFCLKEMQMVVFTKIWNL